MVKWTWPFANVVLAVCGLADLATWSSVDLRTWECELGKVELTSRRCGLGNMELTMQQCELGNMELTIQQSKLIKSSWNK
ncbi:unnamed protein product [Sphagnum jensenii]